MWMKSKKLLTYVICKKFKHFVSFVSADWLEVLPRINCPPSLSRNCFKRPMTNVLLDDRLINFIYNRWPRFCASSRTGKSFRTTSLARNDGWSTTRSWQTSGMRRWAARRRPTRATTPRVPWCCCLSLSSRSTWTVHTHDFEQLQRRFSCWEGMRSMTLPRLWRERWDLIHMRGTS